MRRIALTMLFGDRVKYVTLVIGLAFAALLIAQQGAIFLGLLTLATGQLQNVRQPDLWVTDPATQYVSEYRSLSDRELERVRSVPGVEWASPFFSSRGLAELADGGIYTCGVIGVDRSSLIGQPPAMVEGRLEDIRIPDAVIVDTLGAKKLGNLRIGDSFKLNERRALVVGICRARGSFDGNVQVYTTIERALAYVPTGRKPLSYILVKAQEGEPIPELAERITDRTSLAAFTNEQLSRRTIDWILRETGIGINFGITVLLGLIVGLVVSAAILYQFTSDNIRHFAVFKAMGARSTQLATMVVLQALVAGVLGYGIGIGFAGIFGIAGSDPEAQLVAMLPWQLMAITFAAMLLCVVAGSMLSLRRVVGVEPGMVFK